MRKGKEQETWHCHSLQGREKEGQISGAEIQVKGGSGQEERAIVTADIMDIRKMGTEEMHPICDLYKIPHSRDKMTFLMSFGFFQANVIAL